jgi:DNA-binding MarR family transcriptional regulator
MMSEKAMMPQDTFTIMKSSMQDVDLLEQSHSIRILLAMRQKDEFLRTELYKAVDRSLHVLVKRVDEMIDAGLILEEPMTVRPFAKVLTLSEEGRKIADSLHEVDLVFTQMREKAGKGE